MPIEFDSETLHTAVRKGLHYLEYLPWLLGSRVTDPRLNVTAGRVRFDTPVMVGAGWDKNGEAVGALYRLGFSGVEVGTVTARPQRGNPKPRQFVIAPGVVINRLGFPSSGMDAVDRNLGRYQGIPIGISLGINKGVGEVDAPAAYARVAQRLRHHSAYFAINVSSPNTPGLQNLQNKRSLARIIQAVQAESKQDLYVKISPDLPLSGVDDVVEVALDSGTTGIIAANTTTNADVKARYGERWRNEPGGLSGDDQSFRAMSTNMVAHIYRQAGDKLVIMGVGGVKDARTALEKIKAGASLVQVVTAIRGEGLFVARKINAGLVDYMNREGVRGIKDLVGVNAHRRVL